jgi:chromosome segregation ATPase
MWLLLLACTLDPDEPATPGSPSAVEAEKLGQLAQQAAEIEALSTQLTAQVDESRRAVMEGRSTEPQEVARMQGLMQQIAEKDAALQAELAALEGRLHELSGDTTWPPKEKD